MKNRKTPFYTRILYQTGSLGFLVLIGILLCLFKLNLFGEDTGYYEKIYLDTDRDYYISGENIQFKAYISSASKLGVKSRILYVNMHNINSDSDEIFAYIIEKNSVFGTIELADSLKSGSYILGAYTNWHKNFKNRYAFRKELLIINRFRQNGNVTLKTTETDTEDTHANEGWVKSSLITDSSGFFTIKAEDLHLSDLPSGYCEIYSQGQRVYTKHFDSGAKTKQMIIEKTTLPEGLLRILIKSGDDIHFSSFAVNNLRNVNLTVDLDKSVYSSRSLVRLSLGIEGSDLEFKEAELSVSVFALPEDKDIELSHFSITEWLNVYSEIDIEAQPIPNEQTMNYIQSANDSEWLFDEPLAKKLFYPIESDGRIISGQVVDEYSGEIISDALIFFSFADTIPYLDYDRSDSNGYFYFSLPLGLDIESGFVQVWDAPIKQENCRIILEEMKNVGFDFRPKMQLDQGEDLTQKFSNQVKAYEINSIFQDQTVQHFPISDSYAYSSICKDLSISVFPVDYVKLNNFNEIAKEILPGVRLKTGDEGILIRILDESTNTYFDSDPLLLINGLPSRNYNYLASLNSNDVERIDIVRRNFAIGSLIFPGVLSLKLYNGISPEISAHGEKLYRTEGQTIQAYSKVNFPQYNSAERKESRRPDFRNTLYWIPKLELDSVQHEVTFYSSDMTGNYRVSIEGLVNGCMPVSASKDFKVEK